MPARLRIEPTGVGVYCPASGRQENVGVRLLAVEPTPEQRQSHALQLLRSAEL